MLRLRKRRRFRSALDRWQKREDRFAALPWSNFVLYIYTICWLVVEKGVIGWDGWATVAALDLTLSIRRRQGKL